MRLQTLTDFFRSRSFLIFIVVALIYPALERKIQVGLWHLWKGNSVRVEEYEIPVPPGWMAKTDGNVTGLLESEKPQRRGLFSSVIMLRKLDNLEMKLPSLWSEEALRSRGVQVFDHRKVELGGEETNCIISNDLISDKVTPPPNLPNDFAITITCDLPKDLSIRFDGDKTDVETYFSILSQMRKHND